MLSSAGGCSLAPHARRLSDDRPSCLENPRPAGAESTLTENVASPFQAEPGHNHAKDQNTNFLTHPSAPSHSPGSGNPCPIQPEASPMPAHDSSGSDQDERLCPPGPEPSERDPEQLVQRGESTARSGGVQS